jgi:RHS repeat-associated protein
MSRSSATSFYHADGLGSVTSLSNAAGALAQNYTFDSFGKQTASTGSLTNPFQYTGRESDSETGLYYYRARYYDPGVGRFISQDPMAFRGGENFYVYAYNNVVNLDDPFGLCPPNCHCGCAKCHVVNMVVTGYDNSYKSTKLLCLRLGGRSRGKEPVSGEMGQRPTVAASSVLGASTYVDPN